MTSIIPEYEYDIFISYRQKDNKYDGWVTDFVDNLRKELEATFKEEVSIYFDINTHDGLLETDDVDASLKNKLKCLIFMPIISRTYCDPKSYAWAHEIKAFVEHASIDKFGLKVRLPNSNVAGRVLPVRIYELDAADLKLYEETTGGPLRGIDFIYKSAGINRPLRMKEENPHENLNHTIYRDQLNKVANVINEIISGLKLVQQDTEKEVSEKVVLEEDRPLGKPDKPQRHRSNSLLYSIFTTVVIILALVALFLFSSGSTLPFNKRDWVLITDFENQTGNPVFDKSLYTAFSLSSSQSRYVNVFPRSRMIESLKRMNIRDLVMVDEKTGREMAIREGIGLYIVPGISQVGNNYVMTAKIIDSGSDSLLKSVVLYAESKEEILPGLDRMSKMIRRELGESRYDISQQDKPLSEVTTSSLEALKIYSIGIEQTINLEFEDARDSYEAALKIDTGFVAAKASLGYSLYVKFDPIKGKKLIDEAVRSVDKLTERERLGILAFHADAEKDLPKAIEYAKSSVDLYPDDLAAHHNAGWYYQNLHQFEKAAEQYKEVIRLDPGMALSYGGLIWVYFEMGELDSAIVWSEKMVADHPGNAWGYAYLGTAWFGLDSIDKALEYFRKSREINPDLTYNLYRYAHLCRAMGNYNEAIELLKHVLEVNKGELAALCDIGVNYSRMGNKEEARKYFTNFQKAATEDWVRDFPDYSGTYTTLAAVAAHLDEMDKSQELLLKAMKLDSTKHFDFARIFCLHGKIPEALDQLGQAMEEGFRDIALIKLSPEFDVLKYDTRLQDLYKKYFRHLQKN